MTRRTRTVLFVVAGFLATARRRISMLREVVDRECVGGF